MAAFIRTRFRFQLKRVVIGAQFKISASRRFYSHYGTGNTSKCPFLPKTQSVCPLRQAGRRTIIRPSKKLYSATPDIANHPLHPQRDGFDDKEFEGGIAWRHDERPDYSLANEKYLRERVGAWTNPSSLEHIVSNLVKTLEMEITSKTDPAQWVSMYVPSFRYKANDGPWVDTKGAVEKGSYNILLSTADPALYDTTLSFDDSHEMFFGAFPSGFTWELLRVYSGPPKVSFTWRHWGKFEGQFNKTRGGNQLIEVFGFGTANVRMPDASNSRIRVEEFEVYYDMNRFLCELNGVAYDATTRDAGFGSKK